MTHIPAYLSKAAEDICKAVQYETEENLEDSVNCYRQVLLEKKTLIVDLLLLTLRVNAKKKLYDVHSLFLW